MSEIDLEGLKDAVDALIEIAGELTDEELDELIDLTGQALAACHQVMRAMGKEPN